MDFFDKKIFDLDKTAKTLLYKLFDEYIGEIPMECFSRLKMEEAKKQLRREPLSVSQISDLLGYSSIHNFSRAFKKSVGLSPTAYRKKINGLFIS